MKLLADMGVSQTVVKALCQMGYDAKHLRDEELQRLPDRLIIEKAKLEERVVLTFDLDYGFHHSFQSNSSTRSDRLEISLLPMPILLERFWGLLIK